MTEQTDSAAPPRPEQTLGTGGWFDLSGRRALVTGARRGIGLAICAALAEAGADIVATSASLEPSGSEVERVVKACGRQFEGHQVDFRDRDAVSKFARVMARSDSPINILVNNAGTIERGPAGELSDAMWDRSLSVNLTAPMILSRELGKGMVARGSGKIIFTASLLSFQGGMWVASYTAAKSAVAGLVRALANEWASHGVNVNGIVPGYISTELTQALQDDAERNAAIVSRIPAGRWGRPSEIAGTAVYLASAASDYVHGALVPVDGGWLGR